jgi:N-acetylmuramoyl-L-alanine amidase
MKHTLFFFAFFLCGTGVFAGELRATMQQSPFILVVVPEADTTTTSSAVYRLSASTNPGRSVTINGNPYRVYSSGAFAGLLDLQVGENLFQIASVGAAGDTMFKSLVLLRQPPITTTPQDSLTIDDEMLEPSTSMWLTAGDLLHVQCKGTPNCTGTYLDSLPMVEAPLEEAGGLGGVYRAVYRVKGTDTMTNRPITFRLVDSTGRVVTKNTRAKIYFRGQDFPLAGITKGNRPALAFGLGKDRLGGAKLSFVNPGILLPITGKVGGQYRVALTENQEAWIDDDNVDLKNSGVLLTGSLTGNIYVYGDQKYDYVTMTMSNRMPYSSIQESDPTRIHVDVYGTVSNTNWIVQQPTAREVVNVYYTQPEKDLFRVTMELKHKQIWGYEIGYDGTTLVIKVRRQPKHLDIGALTFALDAGHGGDNLGALGSTGAREKDINLSTVYHLKDELEDRGARVILTRSDDTFSYTSARLKAVLDSGADMLISIHSNSIGYTSNPIDIRGCATFYKYICYRPLSQYILESVLKTGIPRWGNVGNFNFTLNSPTELPNVLVELAFMSNPEDEMKLIDDDFRKELAKKIADGVDDFLESCEE